MATVRTAVDRAAPTLLKGLATRGFAVIDDFLPTETVLAMRAECEGLREGGRMQVSQSTAWDSESNSLKTYDKHNVLSANLVGGAAYHLSPRLVEYCVSVVSSLPLHINERFPEAKLSDHVHTNKLAVCLGSDEGGQSKYDKHYDNEGGEDMRKLTCLIYLQDEYHEASGGCFRMFADAAAEMENAHGLQVGIAADIGDTLQPPRSGGPSDDGAQGVELLARSFAAVDIAPLGGRLLCFWADRMVHGVQPSYAASAAAHRWALTVWLHTEDPSAIEKDDDDEARHFVSLGVV